jgi:hypothetical protein
MRVKVWVAFAAAACVSGCANGGSGPINPSPLAVVTPSAPSSCAEPSAPSNLSANVNGSSVSLSWSSVDEATDYVVLVGWTPMGSETVLTNTSESHHSIDQLPSGTHYARVHAHNWCGTSESSTPAQFTIR